MSDLDAIRSEHVICGPKPGASCPPGPHCTTDLLSWPCDTAIVLAALDERTRQRDGARVSAAASQAALDAALARERRLREAAQDAVDAAGSQNWPVNCDRLRMALAETSEP